jgi:hypothetical protein
MAQVTYTSAGVGEASDRHAQLSTLLYMHRRPCRVLCTTILNKMEEILQKSERCQNKPRMNYRRQLGRNARRHFYGFTYLGVHDNYRIHISLHRLQQFHVDPQSCRRSQSLFMMLRNFITAVFVVTHGSSERRVHTIKGFDNEQ